MGVLIERCAGLDVHEETIIACVITDSHNKRLLRENKIPQHLQKTYITY